MKKSKLITLIIIAASAVTAQAEPRHRHKDNHNYIIERQQAGEVSGVREIDIYRDGSMFEKNNFIGYDKR